MDTVRIPFSGLTRANAGGQRTEPWFRGDRTTESDCSENQMVRPQPLRTLTAPVCNQLGRSATARAGMNCRHTAADGWGRRSARRRAAILCRVSRVLKDGGARSDLDNAAEIHDSHVVRYPLDYGHVVADEKERQAEVSLQLHQQIEHLRLHRDIERGDGLVGDDQLRPRRKCVAASSMRASRSGGRQGPDR